MVVRIALMFLAVLGVLWPQFARSQEPPQILWEWSGEIQDRFFTPFSWTEYNAQLGTEFGASISKAIQHSSSSPGAFHTLEGIVVASGPNYRSFHDLYYSETRSGSDTSNYGLYSRVVPCLRLDNGNVPLVRFVLSTSAMQSNLADPPEAHGWRVFQETDFWSSFSAGGGYGFHPRNGEVRTSYYTLPRWTNIIEVNGVQYARMDVDWGWGAGFQVDLGAGGGIRANRTHYYVSRTQLTTEAWIEFPEVRVLRMVDTDPNYPTFVVSPEANVRGIEWSLEHLHGIHWGPFGQGEETAFQVGNIGSLQPGRYLLKIRGRDEGGRLTPWREVPLVIEPFASTARNTFFVKVLVEGIGLRAASPHMLISGRKFTWGISGQTWNRFVESVSPGFTSTVSLTDFSGVPFSHSTSGTVSTVGFMGDIQSSLVVVPSIGSRRFYNEGFDTVPINRFAKAGVSEIRMNQISRTDGSVWFWAGRGIGQSDFRVQVP